MKKIAQIHAQRNHQMGPKIDPRTGNVLLRNRGVRKALKWRRRCEAIERQALCISRGKTPEGGIPAELDEF